MIPISGIAALTIAALFTGAAIYVSFVEHPARMSLDTAQALRQWAPSYHRGALMQATLALLGTGAGLAAWLASRDLLWLGGSALMFASWPWTLLVIMPTNRRLKSMVEQRVKPDTRDLLERWASLHLARTIFGGLATCCFVAAAAA